jgi:hypothetical protein
MGFFLYWLTFFLGIVVLAGIIEKVARPKNRRD